MWISAATARSLLNWTATPTCWSHEPFQEPLAGRPARGLRGGRRGADRGPERVKNSFNSYPLDRLAIAGAVASVEDEDWFRASCAKVIETATSWSPTWRARSTSRCCPSAANFIFARHPARDAAELTAELRKRAIIVRHLKAARIDQFLRITVGTDAQCGVLVGALKEILGA